MKFSDFKAAIRDDLWPDQEADNLVAAHDRMFVDALIELQRAVSCLRENHRTVVPYCSTYFERGLTVVDPPSGYHRINQVYTLADDCCPVNYEFASSFHDLQAWVSRYMEQYALPKPDPTLPAGVVLADASRDRENGISTYTGRRVGRASIGKFTLYRNRLYAAPWLQSTERLIVEWSGIRRVWPDDIDISDSPELRRAVGLWVKREHLRLYDPDSKEYAGTVQEWNEARANLVIDCRQQQQADLVEVPFPVLGTAACASCDTVYPCDDPTATVSAEKTTLAVISDWGPYPTINDTTHGLEVQELVRGMSPQAVIGCGDTRHSGVRYIDVYNELTYYGSLHNRAPNSNRLWTAIGNHDDDDNSIEDGTAREEFVAFYNFPNNGRYYDIVKGWVHFFFVSSIADEPDGITATSKQAMWLKSKLAVSGKYWNVVVMHYPPYSSGGNNASLQWPFKTWGADVVLSGHQHVYERVTVDNFPYIVCGWSGEKFETYSQAVSGSAAFDATSRGALKIVATETELVVQAVNTEETIVDTLTLEVEELT